MTECVQSFGTDLCNLIERVPLLSQPVGWLLIYFIGGMLSLLFVGVFSLDDEGEALYDVSPIAVVIVWPAFVIAHALFYLFDFSQFIFFLPIKAGRYLATIFQSPKRETPTTSAVARNLGPYLPYPSGKSVQDYGVWASGTSSDVDESEIFTGKQPHCSYCTARWRDEWVDFCGRCGAPIMIEWREGGLMMEDQ